jgi:alpha-L-fucosidase
MMRLLSALTCLLLTPMLQAQQNAKTYIPPSDPLVQQSLTQWQGLKFGLLMHWGTYSEWGIVESWSLCPEDEGWCERKGPFAANWFEYKKAYENLQTSFNPVRFNPSRWAEAADNAGMRYMVFTTKHHDGFCMFDTKQTHYKITDPACPFSKNPRADVTANIFNAFRTKGFKVGAYFSKPDWHSEDFWWPYFPPKDRNINYDLTKYPERYQHFRDFTYNQLEELCTNYGKLDILWLDGGWVRPAKTINREESWQRGIPDGQDIDMPRISAMARQKQPGIILVDRWIPGEFENYLTPEQGIPAESLGVPWETCMTMGDSWSYIVHENYKSPGRLIHTLCDIVSKGGNMLLNIAPGPDGEWHPEAYQRLQEIGAWMHVNSEAIYDTKTWAEGRPQGNILFTRKGDVLYAIYLAGRQETNMPDQIVLHQITPVPGSQITLLGSKDPVQYKSIGTDTIIWLPDSVRQKPPCNYAWVLKLVVP